MSRVTTASAPPPSHKDAIDSTPRPIANLSANAKKEAAKETGAVEKELPAPTIHGETIEYRLSYKHFIPMRWTNTFRPDVKRYTQRNIQDWLAEEPAPMSDAEWEALKARLKTKGGKSASAKGKGKKEAGGGDGKGKSASPKPTKEAKGGKESPKGAAKGKGKGKAPEPEPEPEPEPPKFPSVLILDQSIFPQPKNVLKKGLVRTYDDGRPWLSMFDDGSGSIFHPQGGVAINIIPWQRLGEAGEEIVKPRIWDDQRNSFVQDFYADQFLFTAHSHKKGGELVGLFLPTGRTSWFYQTPKDTCHFKPGIPRTDDPNQPRRCRRGRLRLVTDKLMGLQLDVKGDIVNTWRWFDEVTRQVHEDDDELDDYLARMDAADAEVPAITTTAPCDVAAVTTTTTTETPASKAPASKAPASKAPATPQQQKRHQPALLAEVINAVSGGLTPTGDDLADEAGIEVENGGAEEYKELVPSPAIGTIAGKIDRNIGVKIVSQEKMSLSFQAENKLVSFNVGSKIALLSNESVLDSTCKDFMRDIREFRRTTRALMRKMKDIIPQVTMDLKQQKKI